VKTLTGTPRLDISYEYDDKPNPFYRSATSNWVGSYFEGISTGCFSRNNAIRAIIRPTFTNGTTGPTIRTSVYTYNEQGLPLTVTRDDDNCQVAQYEYETY
jgi:hypothetical protein